MTKTKPVRATLTDRELIDCYEQELYQKDITEKELLTHALEVYFEGEVRLRR